MTAPATTAPPAAAAPAPLATPHPRLRLHRNFPSRHLPRDRDLIVYLPPQYESEPEQSFPVLYMHDGQNLFDPRTAFVAGRTWKVQEAADAGIEAGEITPLIIVGIYNTGEQRMAEYTHTRDPRMGGGQADAYGNLLLRDLLPWIASQYRIAPGAANTGLAGSSLGGLVTLYLGLRHPRVFGQLGVMSPSVWWNQRNILKVVRDVKVREHPRIWLDVGDSEGKRTLSDTDQLEQALVRKGRQDGRDLHYERVPGGTHDEAAWAQRVAPMLRFLYPGPAAPAVTVAEST